LTWLAPHAKRGTVAFEALGLLTGFRGLLVHDGLVSYKALECTHSLCNAHHIRELVYVHEQENEQIWDSWAKEMIDLLLQALKEVDLQGGPLPKERQTWFDGQWSQLLQRGEEFHPPKQRTDTTQDDGLGTRGKLKQSKATNLLKRLREHRQEVWRFMREDGGAVHQQPGRAGAAHGQGEAEDIGLLQNYARCRYVLHDSLVSGNHAQAKGQSV
jgi:transposase